MHVDKLYGYEISLMERHCENFVLQGSLNKAFVKQ